MADNTKQGLQSLLPRIFFCFPEEGREGERKGGEKRDWDAWKRSHEKKILLALKNEKEFLTG